MIDAGLTWVGPSPESIEPMGSKVAAKRLMRRAGVPVLEAPGRSPTEADLPLLVKASAGGGGRGMRVVRALADLPAEVDAAERRGRVAPSVTAPSSSSRTSSTDATSRCRSSATPPACSCSASATARSSAATRRSSRSRRLRGSPRRPAAALHDAARAAAAAIDYRGAGTVEFLYDPAADRFFFLEMNTRLQVEHPVTELVHGVDLVELQLTVAEGRTSTRRDRETYGHAIEVRLYAEDPAADWQPQSGMLTLFELPGVDGEFDLLNRPGIRLDAGFESGGDGVDVLRRDARQGDRVGADPRAGRPPARRRAARRPDPRGRHQPRPPGRVLRDPGFVAGEVAPTSWTPVRSPSA